SEQRRLFAGPLIPHRLVRPDLLPALPYPRGLRFQALHSGDVGAACAAAVVVDVRGAFNLAADPVLDRGALERALDVRTVPVPPTVVRSVLAGAWHLHLAPATPGLFDAFVRLPVLD